MAFRFKTASLIFVAVVSLYFGNWGYQYFLSDTAPSADLLGLSSGGYYEGDVHCAVKGSDAFKIAYVSIALDGKPLVSKFKVNRKQFEHPFIIPTKNMPNGKHALKVEVANGTYAQKKAEYDYDFYVDNTPLQAAFVKQELDYKVLQGRTLHLQFQTNKEIKEAKVHALNNEFDCFPESKNSAIYECFIPVSCEESPNEYMLKVELVDRVGSTVQLDNKFQVIAYPFKKQTINVSPEKVEQEKEVSLSAAQFEKDFKELLVQSPREKLWQGSFIAPLDVTGVSTDFGTIRTSQEKGRYVHSGIDLLSLPKSVIWAPQDGVVKLKERYVYSGNTIVMDHGFGIFSMFFHLDSFANVAVGQKLKKGDPIGKLGKTGYASGYHLHWEMRIGNNPIDPMQWTKAGF